MHACDVFFKPQLGQHSQDSESWLRQAKSRVRGTPQSALALLATKGDGAQSKTPFFGMINAKQICLDE
jgi:hypothetical protein